MSDRLGRVRVTSPTASALDAGKFDFACGYQVAIAPGDQRSSEEWARDIWEGAPAPLRWFMLAGWRFALGLRLGPLHSPEHILGWRIEDASTDETVCQLRSKFLSAHNDFRLVDQMLIWSTFVSFERPWARIIWPPVSVIHRLLVRISLRRAAAVKRP